MPTHRHADSTLIDRIGKEKVCAHFGLSPQALHNWRERGIPTLKRIAFAKLCADHAKPVPDDFFVPLDAHALALAAAQAESEQSEAAE